VTQKGAHFNDGITCVSRAPPGARDTGKDANGLYLRFNYGSHCRTEEVVDLSPAVPPARPMPLPPITREEITTHLTALAAAPLCPRCDTTVISVIADITSLLTVLARLSDELAAARLDNANLRAAIGAALGAAEDGELDPLDYLRWELPGTGRGRA
jgi:hypothetical protein